ncbi:MAG: hypothetical protein ABIP90_05330 [Vicinamibacterales bacterium]
MASSPSPGVPVRATVLGAFLEGWRRVLRAPAITLGVLALLLLLALPLGLALGGMLEEHLGTSVVSERAAWGWDEGWAAEFGAQAQGIGRTFTHEILGFGGTLSVVSGFFDARPLNPAVAGAAAAFALLWTFLAGGIIDRFARGRPTRTAAFFAACGVFFWRFLRLAVMAGAAYWALFAWLHPFLFGTLWNRWTRDMSSEGNALALRIALYVAFALTLALVSIVSDYAKVRAVVEDRRSMVGAVGAALRFLRRRPFRTIGLYLLSALGSLVVMRLWYSAAPPAWASVGMSFLMTQVYLLARVWSKLAWVAGEVVFFQGELAHATYTAAPLEMWPDSPAAEAIENLIDRNLKS